MITPSLFNKCIRRGMVLNEISVIGYARQEGLVQYVYFLIYPEVQHPFYSSLIAEIIF